MCSNLPLFFLPYRLKRSVIWAIAVLATILLAVVPALAQQGSCGIAADLFQVDGQFYSAGPYTDWASGDGGTGVFDDAGGEVLHPSLRIRDGFWANGNDDLDAFAGSGNKNNNDISPDGDPWSWGKGGGPAKNDLTDVYASSAIVNGDIWLFLGAATRSNNGASHVDFEISQAGFSKIGDTKGMIIGLGPHAGRTADVDFIVSVDYLDGGVVPLVSFRTWQYGQDGYEFIETPQVGSDVFICTNDQTVPAPPWGAVAPDGTESTLVEPFQFIEIALNLTSLGIDPSVFCTELSTLMFKTRSSPSFTAELKDLTIHQFSLIPTPPSTITADRETYCEGDVAVLCAPIADPGALYSYEWIGPNGPLPDARCISTDIGGTYRLVVRDLETGCASPASTFDLVIHQPPAPTILFDTDVVCAGGVAHFCGPQPVSGFVYQYDWSGPGGPYPDVSCIEVSQAGVYTLTVTNVTTGCVGATGEQTLTVNPLPVASIAGVDLICAGDSTDLCGPEGDFGYAWAGPGGAHPTERCITVKEAGTYSLVLTDLVTGCVSAPVTHELAVAPVPVAAIAGPPTFCSGTQAELCGPAGDLTYQWEGPNEPYAAAQCIQVSSPGTYTLTIVNENGCSSSAQHTLAFDEPLAVTELDDLYLCTGDRGEFCVEASGAGPITYVWRKGGTVIPGATGACHVIPSITATDAGEYTVEVQGKCGDSITRAATLTLADVAVGGITDVYLCEGMFFELCPVVSGLGPYTYEWLDKSLNLVISTDSCLTFPAVKPGNEGQYALTVRGACGPPVVLDFRVLVGRCQQFCSKSKGFWGNPGGSWNGMSTLEVLQSIITPADPLIFGQLGARSLTIPDGSEHCIIDWLPADGPAVPFAAEFADAVVDAATCGASLGITDGGGRLSNGLLVAALVTELNSRIDPRLPKMRICDEMITVPALPGPDGKIGTPDDVPDIQNPRVYSMPAAVLNALGALQLRDSVGGLLALANLALAGALPPTVTVELGEIEAALNAIITLTHDCAFVIECEYPLVKGGPKGDVPIVLDPLGATQDMPQAAALDDTRPTLGSQPAGVSLPTSAYLHSTNPVRNSATIRFGIPQAGRTSIVVYDIRGRAVTHLVNRTLAAGHHTVDLGVGRHGPMPAGVYFLRMESVGLETGERTCHTRKLVVLR